MSRELNPHSSEWRRRREVVLERDGYECQKCGKSESEAESLHAHHNIAAHEGGSDDVENLRTLCQSCHFEYHAEERRKGTLEDIKDIYIRAEVPVFRSREIKYKLECSGSQARKKLKKLVEKGFLEEDGGNGRQVYYKSDLSIGSANVADSDYIVVDGSLVKDGEYIGREDETRQCDKCGKWIFSKAPDRSLERHLKNCSH